jgi:hypothetical protein
VGANDEWLIFLTLADQSFLTNQVEEEMPIPVARFRRRTKNTIVKREKKTGYTKNKNKNIEDYSKTHIGLHRDIHNITQY